MQCLALDDATDMVQRMRTGGQQHIKYHAAADRVVLPENRSIAFGNLHVHSRSSRRLAGLAGSVMPCLRVP